MRMECAQKSAENFKEQVGLQDESLTLGMETKNSIKSSQHHYDSTTKQKRNIPASRNRYLATIKTQTTRIFSFWKI